MAEKYLFTCRDCDSHELIIECEHTVTRNYEKTLYCKDNCDNAGEIAAKQNTHVTNTYMSSGVLDDDHRFDESAGEVELLEDGDEEEDDSEVYCEKCFRKSKESDWK